LSACGAEAPMLADESADPLAARCNEVASNRPTGLANDL
jgi:hypothetical protein